MENENSNNTRRATVYSRDQKRVDKEYYEGLYNDLPKEVVDILMQTHPLMGHNDGDPEATAYRTRRPEQSEVDAVRASRMEQVGKEIAEELGETEQDESYAQADNFNKEYNNSAQESKKIQYVQMNSIHKRNADQQEPAPKKKKKSKQAQESLDFGDADVENQKYSYQEFDWNAKEKEENLNQLYDDDFEDKESMPLPDKKIIIAGIVALVIIGICAFSIISLQNKLSKAEQQLQEQADLSVKYEELQLQKLSLEDEISVLNGTDEPTGETADTPTDAVEGSTTTSEDGEYQIYVALESDTYWSMAKKFYGNGADFKKILDANGLQEADPVKPGQKYKIPK